MLLCAPAWAVDTVLMHGDKITVTAQDMQADSLRIPPEMRGRVLSRPDQVAQIASNLYVRRGLAQQAEAAGLGADPEMIAALRIARDKVLSDAFLARMDKDNAPSEAKAEGVARNAYDANPERFKMPEQVQIRHILIAAADTDAQAKAEKILADLKGGADFAALAKEYSADPGSAAKGEIALPPAAADGPAVPRPVRGGAVAALASVRQDHRRDPAGRRPAVADLRGLAAGACGADDCGRGRGRAEGA